MRSLAMVELLAEFGTVDLVAFDDGTADRAGLASMGVEVHATPWAPATRRVLAGLPEMRSLSGARFWHPGLAEAIARLASRDAYDVVQVEYLQLAPYARGVAPGALRILDLHNVESSLLRSTWGFRGRRARIAMIPEVAALRRLERVELPRFDLTVVVSESDALRLPDAASALVCPNGWRPGRPADWSGEPVAIFVALLGWAPNADAALWLGREIWPRVVRDLPEARLLLVGRNPPASVLALADRSIEVVASPAEIGPHLAQASVALAPLRAGGGSRLKILEALDAGRPVVATPVGAEGLDDLIGRGVVVGETAAGVAGRVVELLRDTDRARALGLRGHDHVRSAYAWEKTLAPLRERVARAAQG